MEVDKIRPSYEYQQKRLEKLKEVIPEAFSDGEVDFKALRDVIDGEGTEEGEEDRFGLFWPGKREARKAASEPSSGTILPDQKRDFQGNGSQNIFIEGENLEVLKSIHKSYADRVKLIYIDPPFNTGNDFVYKDDYEDPVEVYLDKVDKLDEEGSPLTSNTKSDGRFHSNWLNMMYPRLVLGRQLLREDGIIMVSIGQDEESNLRLLMDEIFGSSNFISKLVWKRRKMVDNRTKNGVSVDHEYVLCYSKSKEGELRGSEKDTSKFKNPDNDKRGKWRSADMTGLATKDRRPNLHYDILIGRVSDNINPKDTVIGEIDEHEIVGHDKYDISVVSKDGDIESGDLVAVLGDKSKDEGGFMARRIVSLKEDLPFSNYGTLLFECPPKGWRYDPETMGKKLYENRVLVKKDDSKRPRHKLFWEEMENKYMGYSSIIGEDVFTVDGTREVEDLLDVESIQFPKPTSLLKELIQQASPASNQGDIVMDFFAGSGSTAQATMELNGEDGSNRKFICVQLPEPLPEDSEAREKGFDTVSDLCVERMQKAVESVDAIPDGTGFQCYKLSRSNFKSWNNYEGNDIDEVQTLFDQFETPLVEGWNKDDLLSEVILMQGFPLDSTVSELVNFDENQVLEVSTDFFDTRLYVCLDEEVVAETVDRVDLSTEDTFICLDSALTDELKMQISDAATLKVI